MKKNPQKLNLTYYGFKNPESPAEINFEILGLETLIAEANSRISELKQAVALADILREQEDDNNFSKSRED